MKQIVPQENNGSIRLRFTVDGVRYSFNPVPGGEYHNRRDLAAAKAVAAIVVADIVAEAFDPTLQKYGVDPSQSRKGFQPRFTPPKPTNLLQLWDLWVSSLDLAPETEADHYEMIRCMIVKTMPRLHQVEWFTSSKIAPSTYNKRLGYLLRCFNWAIAQSFVSSNPYINLRTRKSHSEPIKPFSTSEMQAILKAFAKRSPHYVPFAKFLFLSGCRISEVIGLTWSRIDFERNTITIAESLPTDRTGNGYTRKRKATKTYNVRVLNISTSMLELLKLLKPHPKNPDLLFTTVKGCVIDAGNFRSQYWIPALEQAKVPYRKVHCTRHTTASHAIEQGTPIPAVAYLLGHRDSRMVLETYGHMVNRPELPNLGI